ncbi:MAG: glycosyltransferase [Planctomycetales bacterium]
MRIFVAVASSPNAEGLPQSRLWHENLVRPLIDLGHEVVEFDFDWSETMRHVNLADPVQMDYIRVHRPRFSEELWRQVLAAHANKPLDLFFSYLYSGNVLPETIRRISGQGVPTVNWYCNASFQLDLVAEIAPAFDYCLVPEKFRLEDYRRLGANPIYCQEAANPDIYKPYDVPQEYDVTFVGQAYGNRPGLIGKLIEEGVSARVWGPNWIEQRTPEPGWKSAARRLKRAILGQTSAGQTLVPAEYCGGPLSDEELVRMYSRSKISLGFTSVGLIAENPAEQIKQVRLRDFEATMSGAFYLVEEFDELAEFFEPGKEIVMFRDGEELVEKARYYLKHEQEREEIRQAGLKRAREEHTWHKRFEMVFEKIGLAGR